MQQFNCGLTTMKGREQHNHQPALQTLIQQHATTPGKAAAALPERSSKADAGRAQKIPNIQRISRILTLITFSQQLNLNRTHKVIQLVFRKVRKH